MSRLSVAVRHGKARLGLVIGENLYTVRPTRLVEGGRCLTSKAWRLNKSVGEGAAPVIYTAYKLRTSGVLACTCPDHQRRGSRCKHLGALIALGLLSARKPRPSEAPLNQAIRWLAFGPKVEGGVA